MEDRKTTVNKTLVAETPEAKAAVKAIEKQQKALRRQYAQDVIDSVGLKNCSRLIVAASNHVH